MPAIIWENPTPLSAAERNSGCPLLAIAAAWKPVGGGEQEDTAVRSAMRWEELLESYLEPKLDQTINNQIQDYLGNMLQ